MERGSLGSCQADFRQEIQIFFFLVIPCCRLSGDAPLMGSLGSEHRKRCCWFVKYMGIKFFLASGCSSAGLLSGF